MNRARKQVYSEPVRKISPEIYFSAGVKRGIDIFNIQKETHKYLDSNQGFMNIEMFNMLEDEIRDECGLLQTVPELYILNSHADSIVNIGMPEGLSEGCNFRLNKDDQQQIFVGSNRTGCNIFPAC